MIALAAVSAAASLAQGISAMNAGNAANKAANAAASQAEASGQTQAATERRKGNLAIGSQIANFGAMGMDPLGNALDVLQNSAFENELSAQTLLTNARYQAWDYRVQGARAKQQGRMAFISSIGNAASSALIGAKGFGGARSASGSFASSGSMGGVNGWAGNSYTSGYTVA